MLTKKKLERLIGELRLNALGHPRCCGKFYRLQMDLTADNHASRATAYLSKIFHRYVKFRKYLCADMGYRPTYLAEIFQRLATDVGYTDDPSLVCGEVWINPNEDGVHFV